MTWILVIASKAANVLAPLFIAKATNELADGRIKDCMVNVGFGNVIICQNRSETSAKFQIKF